VKRFVLDVFGRAASGFSPGAAARHSQYARVYTEFVQKNTFCFHFLSSARSGQDRTGQVKHKSQKCEFSRLNSKMARKTPETNFEKYRAKKI